MKQASLAAVAADGGQVRAVAGRLRNRLAVTTVLTALPFLASGGEAYAECIESPPATFVCSGANTTAQSMVGINANASTAPGFSVDAVIGNGVNIRGTGHIQFNDENASSIAGAIDGLVVQSEGNAVGVPGAVTINANGNITGRGGDGITADNKGSGDLAITANGDVAGDGGTGIYALNSEDSANLAIITGAGSAVRGRSNGISAVNEGSGDLAITANGSVNANLSNGIYARNEGADLTITTGTGSAISGSFYGASAFNNGNGALAITASGSVNGTRFIGIRAFNSDDSSSLTITTEVGSVITGGYRGIAATNEGSGELKITVNGSVTGRSVDPASNLAAGISASNSGTNLTITTEAESVVSGAEVGIFAENEGSGDLTITAGSSITGKSESGILADNKGGGGTSITVGATGLVQGKERAIKATSGGGQAITVTNAGLVRNLSGESSDRAIETEGGAATITNSGLLIGTVSIAGDFFKEINNVGVWNSAGGESDFGAGVSGAGNTGTFIAADDGAVREETRLVNLDFFFNSGLVSLADGGESDSLEIAGNYTVLGDAQGRLAVDALLGPAGETDQLIVGGNTFGTTKVSVHVVDALGANLEGIPVVKVTGATAEEHFDLDGPLNAGVFTWGLRLDIDGKTHELFTTGIGVGAFELAAGITGAQEIAHQTMGTLHERQADLRPLLNGMSVTPVADYAEPVAPASVTRVTPGFWFKGVGAYIDRDDEEEGFTLDRQQTIWGGMAGFDFGEQSAGAAWLFGAFAGYLTSDLDFDETRTEWAFEGPTVGVYATYLDHGLHVDATVKADFLAIDIDPEDLAVAADDADTDAVNIGGRIDTGYKFGETLFIEPQASLAVVHTEIDDVDIFGITADFDDETNIRGRLGLRLGFDQTDSAGTVYSGDVTASVWEDFSGDNDVSIIDAGLPAEVSDDPGQTTGDISLGFSAASPEGWSGFFRANYLFAEDYEAIAGNAGIRLAW